jgi:hypothetical protein
MQRATINNLFLIDRNSFKVLADLHTSIGQGEFYQQIANKLIRGVYTREAINRLGDKLTALAHQAYTFRQRDVVEQASQMLMNLPLSREYRSIGRYYHSFILSLEGRTDEARTLLEKLEVEVPCWYRGRIIMSLAGLEFDNGDFQSALPLYIEVGHAATAKGMHDLFTLTETQRQIAVLKSVSGDHNGAVAHLEKIYALARTVGSQHPAVWYAYRNSLAVELGEVGRIEEAQYMIKPLLQSPFAPAFPEWIETGDELTLKSRKASRSFIAIGSALLTIETVSDDSFSASTIADAERRPEPPAVEPSSCAPTPTSTADPIEHSQQPVPTDSDLAAPITATTEAETDHRPETAGLILFPHKLQSVPPPTNPDAVTPDELAQMTTAQKRGMLSALIHDHHTPDQDYVKMLEAVGLVKIDQGPKEIDLESDSYLSRMVIHWCGAIDCEQIAAVMSALRDCNDDLRRNNIINKIISFAFRESLQHFESENDWRKRVEARLKPLPTPRD